MTVDRYSSEVVAVITAQEYENAPTTPVLRCAVFGGMYDDPDNPSNPPTHYQGNIKSDVIFKKQIGIEFWREESAIDFGYLDIAMEDQKDDFIDWGKNVLVATVEFYRVNLSSPSDDQLSILARARTADIGFQDDFKMRLRLESILQTGFDSAINERFYGYEYPHLTGKPYLIAWGLISDPWQLLPTIEVDPTQLLYHVTDLEIDSIEGFVYDRGIALTDQTPNDEFDPTTYGFVLNQNPNGKITCGRVLLKDPEDTANHLHGLFRFVRLAMTRTGIWSFANEAELTQLETDIGMGEHYPHFFSDREVSLDSFLKRIFAGVTGWYYVDEVSEVHFGRMTDPAVASAVPYVFTDANIRGKFKVEDDKAPGLTVNLSYAYNPGFYDVDEVAGGVYGSDRVIITTERYVVNSEGYYNLFLWTADETDWTADGSVDADSSSLITADGFKYEVFVEPGENTYWVRTEVRIPVILPLAYSEYAFTLAEAEVTRWWSDLYYTRRRFYTFSVQLNDDQFEAGLPQLGEVCSLQSNRFKLINEPINLFVRRLEFNFSKNLLKIEGWG